MRTLFLLPLFLLLAASASCGPAAELVPVPVEKMPVEIVGGYTLGRPPLSGLKLYRNEHSCDDDPSATCYPTIIGESVVKIGWNRDYVVVERHPRQAVIGATPDASNAKWVIIVAASHSVYGNLSYEEFTERLDALRIPHSGMQDAMDVYKYGSERTR